MKHILLTTAFLCFVISIYAQSVDCNTALPVCSNGDINENSFGSGIDDFENPNNSSDCLLGDEHQSLWLFIQIASGNNLGFNIEPNGLDDYDFAVYGPNVECEDLGIPIRCSYAAPSLFGGDPTGLNSSSSDFSETASGNGYVHWLDVNIGETYYILIDNFSASSVGFNLEWTGDAVLNCDVTLPCPIVDLGNDTTLCGAGTLVLGGPSSPLEDYIWNTGQTSSSITVDQAGTYILSVTKDTCTISDTITINFASDLSVDLGQNVTLCTGDSFTFDATHPNATSYLWQDGSTGAMYTSVTSETVTVIVSNGGCSVSDQVSVSIQNVTNPTPNITGLGTICPGETQTLVTPLIDGNDYVWSTGSTGNIISINSGGIFWVQESNACFTKTDSFTVEQSSFIDLELGNDTALCINEVLELDVTDINATSYLWQDGSTDPVFVVSESGVYTVEIMNGTCVSTDEIEVVIASFSSPTPVIQGAQQICYGTSIQLTTIEKDNHNYLWSTGETTNSINVTEGGVYWLIESNPCFEVSDTFIVEELDYVPVDLGNDTALCIGESIIYDVYSSEATGYLWQDGNTDSVYAVTETGTYSVEITNGICSSNDTVYVIIDDFEPPIPQIQGPVLICDDAAISLTILSQPFHTYLWSTGSTGNLISINEPGIYWVEETNSCFSATDSVIIEAANTPSIEISGFFEICDDESTELSVVLADDENIEWNDGSETESITVFDAGTYIATVANQCGIESDTIEVIETKCDCNYFIPNAFTPNSDNLNDVFKPSLSSSITNVYVQVYNRWGGLVFEADAPTFSWDGMFEGKILPNDVYSYYIELKCSADGSIIIEKGALTIIR